MKKSISKLWLIVMTALLVLTTVSCGDNTKAADADPEADNPPVISSFTVSPVNISAASDVTLSWSVSGADSLEINQGVGDVSGEDNATVHATATTTYTLTATGDGGSVTAQATVYRVDPGTVYTPEISPGTGTFEESVTVSITCGTADADIYYTLDGTDPTDQSTPYTASFVIDTVGVTVVKAMAVKTGMTNSAINSVQYTVTEEELETVDTPEISPGTGTFEESVTVSITCGTADADIYYTLDGSDPTDQSTPYTASFVIHTVGVTVVKAMAVKTGMTNSAVRSRQYTVTAAEDEKFVADYTVAKESVLRAIPDSYITTARTTLHVAYNHTSHGTQLSYGVYGLPGFKTGDSTKFGVTCNAATADPTKLDIRDRQISGAYADLSTADANWDTWRTQVRTYLDNAANAHINVMIWSWCDIAGHNVTSYLSSMQTLIDEYKEGGSKIGTGTGKTRTLPVTFIFMTGHANGNNNVGAGKPRNQAQLITDYCNANGYYCIDYYSIDSHAMDDTYYEDVNDNAVSTLYGGNFYADWQDDHTLGTHWYYNRQTPDGTVNCSDGHTTQHITGNRKAFAFWWVLARIAGYGG